VEEEGDSEPSTQEEETDDFPNSLSSYASLFRTFLVDPQVLKHGNKSKSNKFNKFKELLSKKRCQVAKSFKEIKGVATNLPEFTTNNGHRNFRLFHNITLVVKSICFGLMLVNGDTLELTSEFLECVSSICFAFLRQGSKQILTSFEEVYLVYLEGLQKLQSKRFSSSQDIKRIATFCVSELPSILENKFLICELLFILYETLLDEINDVSKVVLSSEEKR
jgi:hypothetical protein